MQLQKHQGFNNLINELYQHYNKITVIIISNKIKINPLETDRDIL